MYGKAVLPFFLCRVRDIFFLFLNIVHVTDSNIIIRQSYYKKVKCGKI